MKKPTDLKPGQPAPASGQYRVDGPRGGEHGEITGVKGKPLPPTEKPGQTYTLVDGTDNKSGRP